MSDLINNQCRTAPATPGLLNMLKMPLFPLMQPAQSFEDNFKSIFWREKNYNQSLLSFAAQIAGKEI